MFRNIKLWYYQKRFSAKIVRSWWSDKQILSDHILFSPDQMISDRPYRWPCDQTPVLTKFQEIFSPHKAYLDTLLLISVFSILINNFILNSSTTTYIAETRLCSQNILKMYSKSFKRDIHHWRLLLVFHVPFLNLFIRQPSHPSPLIWTPFCEIYKTFHNERWTVNFVETSNIANH